MARVFVQDTEMKDIANAIREKNGSTDTYKPSEMGNAIREIVSGGENPLMYAVYLKELFMNTTFPNDYELLIDVPNVKSLTQAFYGVKGIKKICINGNNENSSVTFDNAFRNCEVEIIDCSQFKFKLGNGAYALRNCMRLTTILGEIDFSECTSTIAMFTDSNNLKELRFKPNTIKLTLDLWSQKQLSNESIQSIIDGLATVETSQTLTFHADVKAKLTEAQLTQITSKNWTLA